MQRRSVQRVCLLAVVILAAVLRIHQLKDLPAGFFCDEAAEGYNAYAIAKAGMDVDALAAQLQSEGAKAFSKSWNDLMEVIASKAAALRMAA
jgi:transaldolase